MGLLTHASICASAEGVDPHDVILDLVADAQPNRALEVGCGLGVLASRFWEEKAIRVFRLDSSPRMVELAQEWQVDAQVGDPQKL